MTAREWKVAVAGAWLGLLPVLVFPADAAVRDPGAARTKLESARELLAYDATQPLDVRDTGSFTRGGVEVRSLTYASPGGGRVSAYLVVPPGRGPHAGVVFGHWGNGNRTEFLPEAMLLAEAGAVSVLIDYPWERPAPFWRDLPGPGEPEKRLALYVQTIVDLRRAFDLLLSRPDIDPRRVAYVGHSYGAQWGAILAAIDRRMTAAVLMAGVPSAASLWLEAEEDAGLVEYRRSLPPEQLRRFVEIYGRLDAIDFVPHAAPVALLLQFARLERVMTEDHMRAYALAASEPKSVLWYDAGHELMSPRAMADRARWLETRLVLRSLTKILKRTVSRQGEETP